MKKIYFSLLLLLCLQLFNANLCDAQLPVAAFSSSDTTFCNYDCLNFMDLSTNATSWKWFFPGAYPDSSMLKNPSGICYYTAGNFDVTLIASNANGSDTLKKAGFIMVYPSPPAPFITMQNDTLFCSYDTSYVSYQWYNEATLIPGATDSFYVITNFANYSVMVTNRFGCSVAVGMFHEGINNFSNNQSVSVYPNPAVNQLNVYILREMMKKADINVRNMLGEKLMIAFYNPKEEFTSFDVSKIPRGIYFVEVGNDKGRWVQRFIKE